MGYKHDSRMDSGYNLGPAPDRVAAPSGRLVDAHLPFILLLGWSAFWCLLFWRDHGPLTGVAMFPLLWMTWEAGRRSGGDRG